MGEWLRAACCLGLTVIAFSACQPAKREARKLAGRTEPQVRAIVVAIRTTIQPANKTVTHNLLIGPEYARSTAEVGSYRLFDLKQNRVLFVNEFAKTFRAEALQSLSARRAAAAAGPLPAGQPRMTYARTGATRTIAGVAAAQSVAKLGGYQRELWIGEHPLIPPQLFAMSYASAPASSSEPIEKDFDAALLAIRGFPLLDHSELPYGSSKIVVDHQVVSVEQKNVPLSLVVLPSGFTDVTPRPKEPAASRPPASSRPPGQKTPGVG